MLSRDHAQRMRDLQDATPPLYVIGQIDNRPQYGLNTLFLNRGDDTYSGDRSIERPGSFRVVLVAYFLDVDLDGCEDVLISNGMERGARDLDVAEQLKVMRAARTDVGC